MGILAEPWPDDLDPSRVPFRQRTITVLKGMRLWDDMTRIDHLTVDDVAGYWVTGPVTVNDVITCGNEAIAWHHNEPSRLKEVSERDWSRQVWRISFSCDCYLRLIQRCRHTMRPLVGSYTDTSTSTLSPAMIRIPRPRRIFPDALAMTSRPESSSTRNSAFRSVSTIVP